MVPSVQWGSRPFLSPCWGVFRGERTLRHHAVGDTIHRWAERAGLQPEREKPGLLLPQRPEKTSLGRRRPADIFVPSLAGLPTALDIAVTAPQRSESLREASCKSGAAADAYTEVKAGHLQTGQNCERQGVRFQPLSWKARAPGLPRRLTISGFWLEQPRPGKAKTLQHATPNSFKSFASLCGDTEHGQSFVAELNWPILLMVMLPALLLLYSLSVDPAH